MTARDFILQTSDEIQKAVDYGYPIELNEEAILWYMEEYAEFKVDKARGKTGNFTNGTFTLFWQDVDTVRVQNNRLQKYALIHGGDLEGMFNALIQSTPHKIEPEWNTDITY